MPLPGKQVVTTWRNKGGVRQKSWKKMIAVSQSLIFGNPVAPIGATSTLPAAAMADPSAFLQAFVLDDAASVTAVDKNPTDETIDGIEGDALDEAESIEIAPIDGAIWQPPAQTIASLLISGSGEAVLPEAKGGVTALLGDDQLAPGSPVPPESTGETPTESVVTSALMADPHGAQHVEPALSKTAATGGRPDKDVPKPTVEKVQDFGQECAPQPAAMPQSANAKDATPGKELSSLSNAMPKRPDQPREADTPAADAAGAAPIPPKQPKQPYLGPDATMTNAEIAVSKPQYGSGVSTTEAAWRQKWLGDITAPSGNDVPDINQNLLTNKTDLAPVTGPVPVPTPLLAEATKEGAGPKRSADLKITIQGEVPPSVPSQTPAAPATTDTSQPVASATSMDASFQSADTSFDILVSLDAGSPAPPSAALPPATPLPLVPLQSPAPPALPAAVSPTLVDMVKSGNDGPLELALSPEELGRLTISIKHDGDFVRVTVIADRPETLDLMRRHAGDLVADLRQAGFSGASLSFGQGGQGGQPRFANAETATHSQPSPQHLPPDPKPAAPSRSHTGSGVDLRF